jgi:dolichol-phosphate mannosyltransferase
VKKLADLDIIIPVYNEAENISPVLDALCRDVHTPFRVLICYDFDEDNTLEVISAYPKDKVEIILVKNPGTGPHNAMREGIAKSTATYVLTHMADDDYTTSHIDFMVEKAKEGYLIVTGSRFMKGGSMIGCPWFKKFLTWFASFTLYHFARFPVHDATHGVRVFSRKVIDSIEVESRKGFSYSFELMVKVHRLGWNVYEFPVVWQERQAGTSRFQIRKWFFPYMRWYIYAFATTWLKKDPSSALRKNSTALDDA